MGEMVNLDGGLDMDKWCILMGVGMWHSFEIGKRVQIGGAGLEKGVLYRLPFIFQVLIKIKIWNIQSGWLEKKVVQKISWKYARNQSRWLKIQKPIQN